MTKYIVDTNFVLRYLLADNIEQFEKTKHFFSLAQKGEIKVILLESVFTEIIFVLSSFYKVPRSEIHLSISAFLAYRGLITDTHLLLKALDYYKISRLHIVDCLIAAKTKSEDIDILTFDAELEKFVSA